VSAIRDSNTNGNRESNRGERSVKIKLVGASGGEVTGSAYVVRANGSTILVDAGMFQGGRQSEAKNKLPSGVRPQDFAALLLTHGHLDHTGRVPLLIKHGFRGPIFASAATIDLSEIILKDSAKLQAQDAERKSRDGVGRGLPRVEPLYEPKDVDPFRKLSRAIFLNKPVKVAPGMTARWLESGHMLGSGSIELTVEEDGRKKVVVFSGDLGPESMPILKQFQTFDHADAVFLESTYGDRDHRPYAQTVADFENIVREVSATSGKMLVPTFAIGRSQQILFHMAVMFLRRDVPGFPVYLDSPMAIEASKVYVKHPDLHDEELWAWRKKGLLPLNPKYFQASTTPAESKRLNSLEGPCAILAGGGMCTAGRILHHLRFNLPNPSTHVVIVGFQGDGSLGRKLVEKQKMVYISGERVPVKAKIHTLNGFSGHAGQSELLKWFATLAPSKPRVFLTHGEDRARQALSNQIKKRFKLAAHLPQQGEVVEI
jgi:metallo-beta-lactamase family protein